MNPATTSLRLFAAVAVLLALAAGTASAQSLRPWRHGALEAKSDAGILFMATKRELASKLGLKLQFMQFKNDTIALKALLAGELDSFEGGAAGAMVAASRGADVKIVGCNWLAAPHGVYARPAIASLAELRGKSVAVSAPGSFPEILARIAFEKVKIPLADVKFAAMGSDTDRYKALIAGVVDAAVITNEFEPLAGATPIHNLAAATDAMPDFIRTCIQMTSKVIAERNEDAARFLAAEIDGLRYAIGHRDDAIRISHEITGTKADDPRAAFIYDAAMRANAVPLDLPAPLAKLDYMEKELIRSGVLAKPIDVAKMIDTRPRDAALTLLAQ